eukprot:1161899-Pelagomonas_calceolata.AAC.1
MKGMHEVVRHLDWGPSPFATTAGAASPGQNTRGAVKNGQQASADKDSGAQESKIAQGDPVVDVIQAS